MCLIKYFCVTHEIENFIWFWRAHVCVLASHGCDLVGDVHGKHLQQWQWWAHVQMLKLCCVVQVAAAAERIPVVDGWHSQSIPRSLCESRQWLIALYNNTTTIVLWPFVRDYPGEPVPPPTHHPDHHPVFISFFHLLQSIASSLFKLRAWQSFCTTSLHVLFSLPLGQEPSTSYSYISSPNQCLLFAAHAHTIATWFAVVSILSHLFLVFLSTPYLELSFTLTLHIHLTILISARFEFFYVFLYNT